MKEEILKQWLQIEFDFIGNKLELFSSKQTVSMELIKDTIRCLDYLTLYEKDESVNYIIGIIALMWEHVDSDKYDLKRLIIRFLSRIGYPTSAIIVDKGFDKNNGTFSPLNSVMDKLINTLNQLNNEVLINQHTHLLTNFQIEIWKQLNEKRLVGISAPTSAGKSYIILLSIINKLLNENVDIVYIVPTLSLVNQVTEDFNVAIKKYQIPNCVIRNSYSLEAVEELNDIYVLTQEKAIAAFSNDKKAFQKKLILIVDEIQNIERIQDKDDERAKILFDLLLEFKDKSNVEQIVIAGPRIENIDKVGFNIFGKETVDVSTDICPVLNLTYSICKNNKKYYLKQYSAISKNPIVKEITNYNEIKGYGKKEYDKSFLNYLNDFVDKVGKDNQNIIFSPTSKTARQIAESISDKQSKIYIENKDLALYYSNTVHKNYSLGKTVIKGVAYHHGKLPMHIRRTLERAIADKKINCIACTTTLMQGVNMPAQNIIVRNPHLYCHKTKSSAELSNYEMANLHGRAGRLLKDFIGRTYVLDESSFSEIDEYGQIDLFAETTKELPKNYETKFNDYVNEILETVTSNQFVGNSMEEYGYLISYIRQSVLRYGKESKQKLHNVGIKLSKDQIATIIKQLNTLSVSKDICYKNRYWDPFVLNKIYLSFKGNIPSTPSERGAQNKLNNILKFLRDTKETAHMYESYIPKKYQKGKKRSELVQLAIKWAKEESLSEILSDDKYNGKDGSDLIDETITILQNIVSYQIPLLLKPIFDIFNPDNIFLTCLQCGATNPIIIKFIEMGIPRETSIFIYKKYFTEIKNSVINEENNEEILKSEIKKIYSQLPYWIQVQLDFLI